ncbi:MAG: hypothetical protein GY749_15770, partial [Desulfobacteraceae bacterium]|nr:hypothetical protein [Desulfobacteraceae bacterium]
MPDKKHSFIPVWNRLEQAVQGKADEAVSVSDLANELARPPFGLKRGTVPVLICYYLAVKSEELALYQNDVFIPFLGTEEMEMMTKRPEFFSLIEKTGLRHGHKVLFLPVHHPELNPIELVWAVAKNECGRLMRSGIKFEEVRQHLENALEGISALTCHKM